MLKSWTGKWIARMLPFGPLGLFFWAFAESSFFPIPPDFLLIALAMINPKSSLYLALLCTLGSITGAVFGYVIGIKAGKPIIEKLIKKEKLDQAEHLYQKYDVWAIGIAGFTPLPYKLFTITAGMFELNLKRFIIVSLFSRGGRFFMVGTLFYFFGDKIKPFILKYLDTISIVLVVLLIAGFYSLKFLHRKEKK